METPAPLEPDHGPGPGKADAGDVSFPMLLGLEEPLCQELAERLRDGWNTRRPKDIYNITTYARLQEGFRNVILGIDITGWQKRREEES